MEEGAWLYQLVADLHDNIYISATNNLRRFLSDPCQHTSEVGCARLSASYEKNMSHWGNLGWG